MVCSMLMSCEPDPTLPIVTTIGVTEITDSTALCMGDIKDSGNADITAEGFCWSEEINPALDDNSVNLYRRNSPVPPFTSTITGLKAATEYYVRAYATNSVGTAYGENVKFVTLEANPGEPENPETPENPGEPEDPVEPSLYEYVDMGLPSGTKWATFNVGATVSHEAGDYFAWGELETKDRYMYDNCTTYGKELEVISGNADYDVAASQWGDGWRMPTLEEMYELTQECTWIWSRVNNVSGYNVVSNHNGMHIFLPTSGVYTAVDDSLHDAGRHGYYWTATPYDDSESESWGNGVNTHKRAVLLNLGQYEVYCEPGMRSNGMTVRPVKD